MNNSPIYGNNPYYPSYSSFSPSYIPPNSSFQPPSVQPSLINGRSVSSIDEITAGEVPLNGSLAVFPKTDGSIIYVKSTNGNGTIDTKYYIPAPEGFTENVDAASVDQTPAVSNQDIMNMMIDFKNQLDNLQLLVQSRPNSRNNRKPNGNKEKIENE